MAVLQMQKLCICALKKDRKSLMEFLQAAGVLELSAEAEPDEVFKRTDTLEDRQKFERNAATADRALEVLAAVVPEETSMLAGLAGKPLAKAGAYRETEANAEALLGQAERILNLQKQITEEKTAALRLLAEAESLKSWQKLEIPLAYQETKRCAILVGAVGGGAYTQEEIYASVAKQEPQLEKWELEVVGSDADQTCIAVICLKEDEEKLETALRSIGFARPARPVEEVPAAYAKKLKAQAAEHEGRAAATEEELKQCAPAREDLKLLSDYYRLRAQKYEALGEILQSEKTCMITGFIPKRDAKGLEEKLNSRFELAVESSDVPEDEEAPVLLSNGTFAASAEGVTASFGLPAKGEMDPTGIMAACYVFLFGLMLSDAAYGFIVFLMCFLALKKFPRMEENLRKSLRLFMYCGLSTLFWGVMFGGYFGDAVDIVSRTYFGHTVTIPALWFVPLNDPMKLLVYSMLFGVIHLFLGLGLKGYMLLKDGKVVDFICDVVLWYLLLLGLILMLLPTELFGSIAQMNIVFPPVLNSLAKGMAIVGALGILVMSARDKKNPILRLALGAYDLYNITGWVSDVLSYSRLLALGLATGVIASVINQMGSMVGNNVFGVIVFILVFCFGHLFNLAINLLGAYVHTCRLQYVEFFGKFYEGGGKAFRPFKQITKYVEIKED